MDRLARLPVTVVDGVIVPSWLTASDHAWLRVLLEETASLDGQPMDVVERDLDDRVRARIGRTAAGRALPLARDVVLRACRRAIHAPAPPANLRRELFVRAARAGRDRRLDVLDEVARSLGATPEAVLDALFADRPGARRLVVPEVLGSEVDVAQRVNLAITQAVLAGSEEVIVRSGDHARSVYRLAKLRRLICAAHDDGDGPRVHVSGPMALFHRTSKYGAAIASFVPALVSTPGWSLVAICPSEGRRLRFVADASAPLARTHALPRAFDSDVERRLDRDLRKLARGWALAREADVVQVGDRLFFPDFTLRRGADRILVEVVGFYTPEYLAKKLEALAAVTSPIIVLLDEDLACAPEGLRADVVLRYRGTPDAAAVVAAAESLLRTRQSPRRS